MKRSLADRVTALAGVFQSAVLADRLAWHGRADDDALTASLESITRVDADSVAGVFGGLGNLTLGLRTMIGHLRGQAPVGRGPVAYYVAALLQLERRVARNRELETRLTDGVRTATRQAEHFGPDHDTLVGSLGDLYSRTAGASGPRLMVRGDPEVLRAPHNAQRVRAVLLAGIRAARLWRQCGGSRLSVLLRRGQLADEAERLLGEAMGV